MVEGSDIAEFSGGNFGESLPFEDWDDLFWSQDKIFDYQEFVRFSIGHNSFYTFVQGFLDKAD